MVSDRYGGNKLGVNGNDFVWLSLIPGRFNREDATGTRHLSRPSDDQGVTEDDASTSGSTMIHNIVHNYTHLAMHYVEQNWKL